MYSGWFQCLRWMFIAKLWRDAIPMREILMVGERKVTRLWESGHPTYENAKNQKLLPVLTLKTSQKSSRASKIITLPTQTIAITFFRVWATSRLASGQIFWKGLTLKLEIWLSWYDIKNSAKFGFVMKFSIDMVLQVLIRRSLIAEIESFVWTLVS